MYPFEAWLGAERLVPDRPSRPRTVGRPCVLLLAALWAGPAAGQTLVGHIINGSSGGPVEGVLVELLDADSTRAGAVLSRPDGTYTLPIRGPGTHSLRVQRIGFETAFVPVDADRIGIAPLDVVLSIDPVELAGITATGSTRCLVDPRRGEETAVLWDQVRKVLEVTEIVHRDRLARFEVIRFRRELTPTMDALRSEELETGVLQVPFQSPPAGTLLNDGFVRESDEERVFFMPDPEVTLSEEFLESHCFYVAEQVEPEGRLLGLAFEPLRTDGRPDVAGVLWLDATSAALRYLDYRYVGLDSEAENEVAGGRAEFGRLPNGFWVVRRWRITMPLVEIRRRFLGLTSKRLVTGVLEEGGEVLETDSLEGKRLTPRDTFTVTGSVRREGSREPLSGATVRLSGTDRIETTDARGEFRLEGLARGQYLATFSHPFLDTLGVPGPAARVGVPTHGERLVLFSPTREAIFRQICTAMSPDRREGVLSGRVSDGTGSALEGASVELAIPLVGERERVVAARTDANGMYRFCGVVPQTSVRVMAALEGHTSEAITVRLPECGFARADLRVEGR